MFSLGFIELLILLAILVAGLVALSVVYGVVRAARTGDSNDSVGK